MHLFDTRRVRWWQCATTGTQKHYTELAGTEPRVLEPTSSRTPKLQADWSVLRDSFKLDTREIPLHLTRLLQDYKRPKPQYSHTFLALPNCISQYTPKPILNAKPMKPQPTVQVTRRQPQLWRGTPVRLLSTTAFLRWDPGPAGSCKGVSRLYGYTSSFKRPNRSSSFGGIRGLRLQPDHMKLKS